VEKFKLNSSSRIMGVENYESSVVSNVLCNCNRGTTVVCFTRNEAKDLIHNMRALPDCFSCLQCSALVMLELQRFQHREFG